MLSIVVCVCLSPAFVAEDKELPEAAQKELKKFEGKWKATEVIADGNEVTPPDGQNIVEFKGRKFLLGDKELLDVAAFDPSTTPKLLDFKAVADMGEIQKGTVYEGIYKIDGDTLTIALHIGEGKKRPEKFESPKDSKVVVVTFQREKK